MYRKTPEKQTTYKTPKGAEEQLDYILIDRKPMRCCKDAEANDMIRMGSGHRSVMAQFVIPAKKKDSQQNDTNLMKSAKKTGDTSQLNEGTKLGEISRLEERYQEHETGVMKKGDPVEAEQKNEEIMTETCRHEAQRGKAAATRQEHTATAAVCTNAKRREAFAGDIRISDAKAAARGIEEDHGESSSSSKQWTRSDGSRAQERKRSISRRHTRLWRDGRNSITRRGSR